MTPSEAIYLRCDDATCGPSLIREEPPAPNQPSLQSPHTPPRTSDHNHRQQQPNGFQEEVGRAAGVEEGAAVLHPGRRICCVRHIWTRALHHQGALLRVLEEAEFQRGFHQEGGAQLSAATGKTPPCQGLVIVPGPNGSRNMVHGIFEV